MTDIRLHIATDDAALAAREAPENRVTLGGGVSVPDLARSEPPPAGLPGIHHPAPAPIAGAVLSSRWT